MAPSRAPSEGEELSWRQLRFAQRRRGGDREWEVLIANKTAVQVESVRRTTAALFARGNTHGAESDFFFPLLLLIRMRPLLFPALPSALISVAAFGIRRPSGSQTKV